MTNDEIVENRKKRQIYLVLIIIFGLLTLGLAIFSLITKFSPIPALISFLIEAIISKKRDKLRIKKEDLDLKNQE